MNGLLSEQEAQNRKLSEPDVQDAMAKQCAQVSGALNNSARIGQLDRADGECPFREEPLRAAFIAGWLAAHVDIHERG